MLLLQAAVTSCCYKLLLHAADTSCCYMLLLHAAVTSCCYKLLLQAAVTSCCYKLLLQAAVTQYKQTFLNLHCCFVSLFLAIHRPFYLRPSCLMQFNMIEVVA
jgi:hypothetical protein